MRPLLYNIIPLFFMLTVFHGFAQQKLYSFSLKATGQFLTCRQGALIMEDTQTQTNKLAQLFIVKRTPDGKTLIASAAKPKQFLKRNGTNIVLSAYNVGDTSFEWDIQYSGYPYASIVSPADDKVLSWQNGGGFILQNVSPGLSANDDPSGDDYRFGISTVTNTF